jgi:hypothetical protein
MPKTASIRDLEQTIEALPQADQFRLLEKLLKQLKHALFGSKPVPAGLSTKVAGTLRGALKQYANPASRCSEENAFAKAMKEKHADS